MEKLKGRLIEFARTRYNMGQNKFEDMCGINKGTISSIKTQGPTASILTKIFDKCPELNMNWLFSGEGNMLNGNPHIPAVSNTSSPEHPIPLLDREEIAGKFLSAFKDGKGIEGYYIISEFRNSDFLIRVKGDAMMPKYSGGDIVACRKISESFLQWGRIYAISTHSYGVMIKRVLKGENEEHLTLISENPKYAPFQIPVSDINSFAIVIGAITLE